MNLSNQLVINYNHMKNKVCLVDEKEKITYEDLYNRVSNFSNYLKERGIKKGDKILVLVPMSIDLYITLLSVWAIGATVCFMDAGFIKSGMVKNDFDNISAVVGITKYLLYSNVNQNLKRLSLKISVKEIDKSDKRRQLEIEDVENDYSAIMTYTSGTTGRPKVASRSHAFLKKQAEIIQKHLKYDTKDIELSTIPIFTLSNIDIGITTVIANANFSSLGESNPKKLIKQINSNNINRLMASPGLLNLIMNYCEKESIALEGIKKVYTGGGAVFLDFIIKTKRICPNADIVTIYGSTEAEPIAELNVTNLSEEDIEHIKCGYGIPAGEIVGVSDLKIIKTGIEEIGQLSKEEFLDLEVPIGEIVVSGENVLEGYVGGIGDKENKFKVGETIYHRTGDMGMLDEKRHLWLKGRIKEPFFDIEAALHASADIGKTAVFMNDGRIILVLETKDNISKEEIDRIITFKKIDDIRYVKKIPVDKRHSTKVDYNSLKKILKME